MAKKREHNHDEPIVDTPPEFRLTCIEVPLADPVNGYLGYHIDAQLIGPERESMRRLYAGLLKMGAKFRVGSTEKPVRSGPDALRWLLQQLGNDPI